MTIAIKDRLGTDLSSRARAAQLRREVLGLAESDVKVVLDFSGVRTVSGSTADELIAVTAEVKGAEWFSGHVQIVNDSPAIRLEIRQAVAQRLGGPKKVSATVDRAVNSDASIDQQTGRLADR